MNIFILTFHKYDKAFASDLYLIYNRSPAARVCKSDTDRLLMLYLVHITRLALYRGTHASQLKLVDRKTAFYQKNLIMHA